VRLQGAFAKPSSQPLVLEQLKGLLSSALGVIASTT